MTMTKIVTQKSFQERMKERIKDSIGELMTDEELAKIVKRAMEEVFFEPQKTSAWGSDHKPPFAHQLIKELLSDSVRREVTKYIDDNSEKVAEMIQQQLSAGAGRAILSAIDGFFADKMYNLKIDIINTLRSEM